MAESKGDKPDKTKMDTASFIAATTPCSTKKQTLEPVSKEEMALLEMIRHLQLEAGDSSTIETVMKKLSGKQQYSESKIKKTLTYDEAEYEEKGTKPKIKKDIGYSSADQAMIAQQKLPGNAYSFPKLSTFSGDNNKSEVSWETFKFEVESLTKEHIFTDEQIMLGIRRAVKGTASDIVRRLGIGIEVKTVIRKLSSTFGSIENEESVMRKLYSCSQGNRTISEYATEVEDYFTQAVQLGAINKRDEHLMKQILYQGLSMELKHIAQYKFDVIEDYDRFKIELRKLEADMKKTETDVQKPCYVGQKSEEKNSSFIETTLKELKEKIDRLEQNQMNPQYQPQGVDRRPWRQQTWRGNRGQPNGRGRGQYNQTRPIAANTFRGACFNCGDLNHLARDCEAARPNVRCYSCGQEGHIARRCPNRDDRQKNLNV